MSSFDLHDPRELSIIVSELLVATADYTDPLIDATVQQVLSALRERLHFDVVFVSEFVDGQRVFRMVNQRETESRMMEPGDADPLEESFCQRIVDGRLPGVIQDASKLVALMGLPELPMQIGAHLSTPIVMEDGRSYGTLCCFSRQPNPTLQERDLGLLRQCAKLVSKKLEWAHAQGLHEPAPRNRQAAGAAYVSPIWPQR
jgi:GAF domain-containing protein